MAIRVHGHDTGGIISVVESHDVPDGGPPPHIHHREDEYEFLLDGKASLAKPGMTFFAPRGVPHTYPCVGNACGNRAKSGLEHHVAKEPTASEKLGL
jgi:hypothetical protein